MDKKNSRNRFLSAELEKMKIKVKELNDRIMFKSKQFKLERNEILREKNTYISKEKQFLADLRKKDNSIKMLQDRLNELQSKKSKNKNPISRINSIEITGEIMKRGPKFYSDASAEFLKMCQRSEEYNFQKVQKENGILREALKELQNMMVEIVKVRKAIFERNTTDLRNDDNHVLTEMKNELFNLQTQPLTTSTLEEMKENVKKFKVFMNKMDNEKFGVDLERAYLTDEGSTEIEEIKSMKKLKDLISKPIFFIIRKLQIRSRQPKRAP